MKYAFPINRLFSPLLFYFIFLSFLSRSFLSMIIEKRKRKKKKEDDAYIRSNTGIINVN